MPPAGQGGTRSRRWSRSRLGHADLDPKRAGAVDRWTYLEGILTLVARIRGSMKDRDQGFTLIELLVVTIAGSLLNDGSFSTVLRQYCPVRWRASVQVGRSGSPCPFPDLCDSSAFGERLAGSTSRPLSAQNSWSQPLASAGQGVQNFPTPPETGAGSDGIEALAQRVRPLEPPGVACGESQRTTVRSPAFTVGGQT